MSTKYLGESFDIHGGGMDLKFPHHECEIAQATAANAKEPVRYWMHSNMLTVNGQKMSKSLGNSFLPSELFTGNHPLLTKGYSPMTVRFFMLQSHYSSTLDFSNEALQAAEKGYRRLDNALKTIEKINYVTPGNLNESLDNELRRLSEACYLNMSDDFNTAKTLAVLFEMSSRINDMQSGTIAVGSISAEVFNEFKNTYIGMMQDVLGFRGEASGDTGLLEGVIGVLIELRKKAKIDRNYALSDKIRDDLKAAGVILKDGKDGSMTFEIER
jgi:cysteinyl-tRNA synthetase